MSIRTPLSKIPVFHLKQHGFTYSACRLFTKHRQRIEKFMQTANRNYIHRNQLDKACFAHDAAYPDSKDLARRTAADKVLRDRAYETASNLSLNGYERSLAALVYKFFDRKTKGSGIKNEITQHQQLANELHKPIIRKFKRRRVHASLFDGTWGADPAEIQLLSKYNKGIRYLLYVPLICSANMIDLCP